MLKQRIITALVLVALVGGLLFWGNALAWQFFVFNLVAIAAWEWAGFAPLSKPHTRFVYGAFVLLLLALLANKLDLSVLYPGLVVLQLFLAFWLVVKYQRSQAKMPALTVWLVLALGALNLWVFATGFAQLRVEFSPSILLLSMMVVWAMDTGAYFTGRALGRRKLAVYASPGKSWEGVYGGFLLAFLVALMGLNYLALPLNYSLFAVALLLAVVGLLSVVGDLLESVLKRQANLKDSGTILPGHGGVLDRVDSLIIAMPLFYLIWQAVL